jgi:hypothetical protein
MTATAIAPETEGPGKAIARRPSQVSLLRPIAPAADVIVAQNETRELIQQALKKGRDYGEIPGTNKPTLFKAGAERTALAFGCYARFRTIETEIDHDREVRYLKKSKVWRNANRGDRSFTWKEEAGVSLGLYRYVVECEIVDRNTDQVVGSFIGSCSSMESKYIDRPRDVENTIIKMSEKRALVGAVLTTFGLSDQFTQDVEDLPRDVVADGQSANAPEDVTDQVEAVKDLAWAKAFPLPFPTHKHSGEPIDTRETKELEGFLKWATAKIETAGREGTEPSTMMIEFAEALRLILADRKEVAERDQTKLPLEPPAPVQQASTSVPVPPAGKVVDALEPKEDPTSARALHKKVKKLLEHPTAVSKEDRDAYHEDNVNGFKKHPLAWWVRSFENDIRVAGLAGEKRAATHPDDSFPEALRESDDDLPF